MKTAVRQLIIKLNDNPSQYTLKEFLEMLKNAEIIQDSQLKIAYIHGGITVLQKSEISSDEYFNNEFK